MTLRHLMWVAILLVTIAYGGVVAQEIVTTAAPEGSSMYELLADKVPGLLTLVFLVLVFFRHLDKKSTVDLDRAKEYKEALITITNQFTTSLDKNTTAIDKLENSVQRLEFKSAK